MANEIEDKLDEDFVFYLGFVHSYLKHVHDKDIRFYCEHWLQKLCGEPYFGIDQKRGRNIYLSQLLLSMQTGIPKKEFQVPINEVDVSNALEVFKLVTEEPLGTPDWLQDNESSLGSKQKDAKPGRTYFATRTMPNGQGAFAYVAVSLDEEEPMLLGGGEGAFDRHMEAKFREEVPDYEMEKILARRKDPKEREKVLTFYKVLLANIEDILDEKVPGDDDPTINSLLTELEQDLKDKDQFEPFSELSPEDLRSELLLLLHDRITLRINKVLKREELLDEIEQGILTKSIFATSITPEDRYDLPPNMWDQVINKAPNKTHIEKLKNAYPLALIEKFMELLSDYKQVIAKKMQRRHENIAAQMKHELRTEDEKGKRMVDKSQISCDQAVEIHQAVKEWYLKKHDAEKRNEAKTHIAVPEHSKLYDEIREALMDTYKSVQSEAERGKLLAAQIGEMNEETTECAKVTEEHIRKIEAKNMETMKNIRRLNAAIQNQQKRIEQIQQVGLKKGKGGEEMEFFF